MHIESFCQSNQEPENSSVTGQIAYGIPYKSANDNN